MTDEATLETTPPTLRLAGIGKSFPGVRALEDVSLSVRPGEVHALIGENGAGKSTLMKILYGIHQPDAGTIEIDGEPVAIHSPPDAQRLGISMVQQEISLVPALDVARNIYLGREPSLGAGLIDWPRLYRDARALLARLHVRLDVRMPARRLSTAQKQMVEIARALSWKPRLLILDEPTSSLTQAEIGELFRILRALKADGVSILYISHRLDELGEIADRVSVLRDGRHIATRDAVATRIPELIRMMVGRDIDQQFPKAALEPGPEVLRVEGLTRHGAFEDVSFSVRAGEIVGMAGLVGAGRSETARVIFGADRRDAGQIFVDGRPAAIDSPADAIAAGVALLPEDRKLQGLVLVLPVRQNMSLATLGRFSRLGVIRQRAREALARRFVHDLRIRTPSTGFRARNLSGGNQQKVVLAKWLASEPKVLIFDEPTRGIDVGAKVEVYGLMNQLAQRGAGILLISSELPEVLGMSDRVLVMREGRLAADLPRAAATPERVIALASGE
ncbi:MAG TPA: sugar ABC transporter ATP-binding protein, partial [Thermomicrobiales bacterium]|nr:sugar ABC transporter ATP-binding protein [Thermomicrobiales bacterium]